MTNHPNRSKHQRGAQCIYRDMTARELDRAIDTQAELLAALKDLMWRFNDAEPPCNDADVVQARAAIAKAEGRA